MSGSDAHSAPFDTVADSLERSLMQALSGELGCVRVFAWSGAGAAVERMRDEVTKALGACVLTDDHGASADTIVIPGVVPHTAEASVLLRAAGRGLVKGGRLLAAFRSGLSASVRKAFVAGDWVGSELDAYAPVGVGIVLSRAGYDVESMEPVPPGAEPEDCVGWIVTARGRLPRVSDFGEERRRRLQEARAANAEGEARYAAGDVMGATTSFAKAIELWNEEALFFNNLATALFALGYYDECWRRVCEALHLNPSLRTARENLRAIAQAFGKTEEAERLLSLFGHD